MFSSSDTTSPSPTRYYDYCLNTLLVVVSTTILRHINQGTNPSTTTEHVFETLAEFISKGQLFIETIPPLPLLAAAYLPANVCHWLGYCSQVLFTGLLVWKLPYPGLRPSWWWLGVFCATACSLIKTFSDHVSLLGDFETVTACLLLAVALRIPYISLGAGGVIGHLTGALETCVVVAGMLGASSVDLFVSYFLLTLSRAMWLCHRDKELIIFRVVFIIARAVVLPPLMICLVYGCMFPFSEVSAGGNYNLSHLKPSSRRLLSPVVQNTTYCLPTGKLVANVPISLYIQRAGFLWTDDFVWRNDIGVFDKTRANDDGNTALPAADQHATSGIEHQYQPHRAFFADPIARRHPWALEAVSVPTTEQNFLLQREPVHVRSQATGRYLSVVRGQPSIVDRELGIHIQDSEPFVRFEVG
ncbi:uncharacterized protein PG986_010662 [Apiospora aurea]|uniref:Uncharacterized protein n=1 Tax=Apiospora aurea TaxID=335848 RepID=A0ABR1Q2W3_9PEZI